MALSQTEHKLYEKINYSNIKHMRLDLDFPYQEIYEEIYPFLDNFVVHRKSTGHGLWKSLTLHGHHIFFTGSAKHTLSEEKKKLITPGVYGWTELANMCEVTYDYFKRFPVEDKARIRFMLLEPGGYIEPHSDVEYPRLFSAINFAITHPRECIFNIGGENIDWSPGDARAVNVHFTHWVKNNSNKRRLHMIFHGGMSKDERFIKLVLENYEKYRDSQNWDEILKQSCK